MSLNGAEPEYIDIRLENIRAAYHALAMRIRTVLLTQADDERSLSDARSEVLEFGHELHVNAHVIPDSELRVGITGLASMVTQLDKACHAARELARGGARASQHTLEMTLGETRCCTIIIISPGD